MNIAYKLFSTYYGKIWIACYLESTKFILNWFLPVAAIPGLTSSVCVISEHKIYPSQISTQSIQLFWHEQHTYTHTNLHFACITTVQSNLVEITYNNRARSTAGNLAVICIDDQVGRYISKLYTFCDVTGEKLKRWMIL